MTFSEYVTKLYPFCGGGTTPDGDDVKTPSDFVIALLSAATTDQDDTVFDYKPEYLKRIFEGKKSITKKSASYIGTHLNKGGLDAFLNDIASEDALIELCGVFEQYIGNSTTDDISAKLADLFVSIIKTIAQGNKATGINATQQVERIDISEVEKALAEIVKNLASLSQQELNVQLRYDPYNVDTKIPNDTLLQNDVKSDVVLYYTYIESLLKEASKTNSIFVDRLTKAVQDASDNYIMQGLSKRQVIEHMTQWIKFKATTANDLACRILVSFFIQNCEVFTI